MALRIVWSPEHRQAVYNQFVLAAKEVRLVTNGWVRAQVGPVSEAALGPHKRRNFMTPAETQEVVDFINSHPSMQPELDLGQYGTMRAAEVVMRFQELERRAQELNEKLRERSDLEARVQQYKEEWGSSVWEDARRYRGQLSKSSITKVISAPAPKAMKRFVVILGVQAKFRHQIQLEHPAISFCWIDKHESDEQIIRKVAGNTAIIHHHGASPPMWATVRRNAKTAHSVNGLGPLTQILRNVVKG
jgi:hypothetical protein